MWIKEKSIHIIEFSGKKVDWKEKFLSHGKHEGYKKLFVSRGSAVGVDKIPTQEEYDCVLEGETDFDNKVA